MDLPATIQLDREFLPIRAALLDVAAALDRINRGDGATAVSDDVRIRAILEAARILADTLPDRAKRIQFLFSDAYAPDWR